MNINFKNLEIWQLSYKFMTEIYSITRDFPPHEENNMSSQLRRASLSVPVNIAEGSASPSNRDFFKFLCIAYKSAKECECLLLAARDVGYVTNERYEELAVLLDHATAKLYKYLKRIEEVCGFHGFEYNQGCSIKESDCAVFLAKSSLKLRGLPCSSRSFGSCRPQWI